MAPQEAAKLNQRVQANLDNGQMSHKHRHEETHQIERATNITEDHHTFAVPAINQRAHDQAEKEIGNCPDATNQTDQRCRV